MPPIERIAALVPGLRRGEALLPGRKLRWLTAGSGAPRILLVPGAGEIALDWLPVLSALAQMSTVVAVDRAGLGASDPVRLVTVESQVDDLVAVLSQAHVWPTDAGHAVGCTRVERTSPSIVVGHSWGGLLVQLLAQQRPDLVAGIVLVDSYHEDLRSAVPLRLRIASSLQQRLLVPMHMIGSFDRIVAQMAKQFAAICTDDPDLRAAIEEEYRTSYRRRHHAATIARENQLGHADARRLRQLRATSVPPTTPLISLIASTGKPPSLLQASLTVLTDLARSAPHGQAISVERAGHYIHHDRPDAVIDAVESMLAEVRNELDGRTVQPCPACRAD